MARQADNLKLEFRGPKLKKVLPSPGLYDPVFFFTRPEATFSQTPRRVGFRQ
jgi:hypothetical protein